MSDSNKTIVAIATLSFVVAIFIMLSVPKDYKVFKGCPPLPEEIQKEIKDYRPFVQDIVKTIHHHPDYIQCTKCGEMEVRDISGRGWRMVCHLGTCLLKYPTEVYLKKEEGDYLLKSIDNVLDSRSLKDL